MGKMTTENEENQTSDEAATAQNAEVAPVKETVSKDDFSEELREPLWAVVSFEKREAGGLTYDEAAKKIKQLAKKGISGLCIVTDEAAERI